MPNTAIRLACSIALTQASAGNPNLSRTKKLRGRTTQGALSSWLISKFVTQESAAARFQRNAPERKQRHQPSIPRRLKSLCNHRRRVIASSLLQLEPPLDLSDFLSLPQQFILETRNRRSPASRPRRLLSLLPRISAMLSSVTMMSRRWGLCQGCPSIPRTTDHEPMTSWIRHGNDIKSQSASRGTHRR